MFRKILGAVCFASVLAVSAQETGNTPAQAQMMQVSPDAKKFIVRRGFAEIVSAEISRQKPVLADENKQDVSPFGENTAWVQLIMDLPKDRGLSRFDFIIDWNGKVCPCMAIALEDIPYSMLKDRWIIEKLQNPGLVRLLFAMPADAMNSGTVVGPVLLTRNLGAKSILPPDQIYLHSTGTFTAAASIHAAAVAEQEQTAVADTSAEKKPEETASAAPAPAETPAAPSAPVQPEPAPAAPAAPVAPAAPSAPVVPATPAVQETAPAAPAIQLNFSL